MKLKLALFLALVAVGAGALSMNGCAQEDSAASGPAVDGGVEAAPVDASIVQEDSCAATCSDDRRSLVCEGKTVRTCADDEVCSGGRCVSACEQSELGKSSVGCDYYVMTPDTVDSLFESFTRGECFAAYVVNTWDAPIDISVDYAGEPLNTKNFAYIPSGQGQSITYTPLPDGKLPPGQVAVLFLSVVPSATVTCPVGVLSAMYTYSGPHGTAYGDTFHIRTSAPVVAYDIYPYGGGASAVTGATLLLPTSVWGTNYVGIDAYSDRPWMAVVAQEDNTDITLNPTVDLVGSKTVEAAAKGTPHTYSLNKGQVLQFVQGAEPIGTPIQATKPIGVWAGSSCMNVVKGTCDAAHQQIPPVSAWGHEYAAVRHRDRFDDKPESPPWRLVGAADGTTLTYVPAAPAGAPTTLSSGQMVEFRAGDPFVVTSQDDKHPFYMAGYMTGSLDVGTNTDGRGDPEFVNVIPPAQFLKSYTLFTDPTYSETSLVVVRTKGADGFADVSLDCAGKLTGWQPLGDAYEWTRIDLVRHVFQPQGTCNNGRHEISSDLPFGVTVWGWGSAETGGKFGDPTAPGFYTQFVSYAYPASAGVLTITDVVVPPSK